MARRISVPVTGDIVLTGTGIGGDQAAIVGAPPQWTDGSDSTYVDLVTTVFGEDNPVFKSGAQAQLGSPSTTIPAVSPENVIIETRARMRGLTSDCLPLAPRLQFGLSALYSTAVGVTAAPLSTTWVTHRHTGDALTIDSFLSGPQNYALNIDSGDVAHPWPNASRHWHVFEVRVEIVLRGDAPPCRLFPRADGLGVGSGRHFPPPKSQQRSGRRFGYY